MAATNQRSTPPGTKRQKGKVKKGFYGTGHAPSSLTQGRQHTVKGSKSDPFRQTSLFSGVAGKGVSASKGSGIKPRARGRHRLKPKSGAGKDMVR